MRPSFTAAVLLLASALTVGAQPPAGTTTLPLRHIVLFSSGVGYYQRDGQVEGAARVDLRFPARDVNDLLKSLIVEDQGGGQVGTVSYDSRDPVEKALKSFAIDLTANPSVGDLLNQVRGEQVAVSLTAGHDPGTLTGSVVGVQKQKKPVGKDQVVETEQLNLLTDNGLHGVPLDVVERIRFVRSGLDQEFRRALEVLAGGHDRQKKTVSLNFHGNGRRAVRIGYVTESPIWKASYRLALEKDAKAFLQGWAIVENTTDEDWSNVQLALVSGRPISFRMDLYEPLYVPRPLVEPELFASLRPQVYEDALDSLKKDRASAGMPRTGPVEFARRKAADGAVGAAPAAPGLAERGEAEALQLGRRVANGPARDGINLRQGVASAAVATELGEYFQYRLESPVSLARQKSALLPIVNGDIEVVRVSVYNRAVHPKFPLLGVRLKNTTGLHLAQGPITVFEGESYAGDARVADLQPNETRLISYAVDLGTEVAPDAARSAENLVAVKIFKGVLHATQKVRHTEGYTVRNRSGKERLVLIEHPYRANLTLVEPKKPAERTRDLYRFEVKAPPDRAAKLEVVEEERRVDQVVLTNADDDTVLVFLRSAASSPAVKEALQQALRLRAQLGETQRQMARESQAVAVIEQDQGRMRANMARVPPTSQAYKRYLQKFDDQETEIEKRREKIARLQDTADGQRKAYEEFLANLTVE